MYREKSQRRKDSLIGIEGKEDGILIPKDTLEPEIICTDQYNMQLDEALRAMGSIY